MQKKKLFDELFDYGCKLLKQRDRSVFEIKEKLKTKTSSEQIVDKVVQKLLDLGYLNEYRFVENYINKYLAKGKNLNLTFYELKEKYKVDDETINKLDIGELKDKQIEIVVEIVKKKYNVNDKRKIYNFLYSKGFSEDEIETVLNNLVKK